MAVTMNLTFTETVSLNRARFYTEVSAANPNRNSQAREGTNISEDMLVGTPQIDDSEATVITHNDGTDTEVTKAPPGMAATVLNR